MLIEGANHFGLAQLHQFRGRVGRGDAKSYCLMIPDSMDDVSNERLKALESTNDGFKLAELDLNQRGAGTFLGTRQSGFAELLMADLTDIHLIEKPGEKHAPYLNETLNLLIKNINCWQRKSGSYGPKAKEISVDNRNFSRDFRSNSLWPR